MSNVAKISNQPSAHPPSYEAGGDGGGNDLGQRVARLEVKLDRIEKDIHRIENDIKELPSKDYLDSKLNYLDSKLSRLLLTAIFSFFAVMVAVGGLLISILGF